MPDYAEILAACQALGLQEKPVIVHASLRPFGYIEGGADAVLDAVLTSFASVIMPTPAEIEMRGLSRRSVVAARELPAGRLITELDLTYRRPGTGLPPYEAHRLIGRKLLEAVPAGHVFSNRDVV